MQKSDLKTGMVVELRNGDIYLVMYAPDLRKRVFISFDGGFLDYRDYSEDLTFGQPQYIREFNPRDFDIVKIYTLGETLWNILKDKNRLQYKTIWHREETKEMTVAEIEKELGYKIRIVGDKDVK